MPLLSFPGKRASGKQFKRRKPEDALANTPNGSPTKKFPQSGAVEHNLEKPDLEFRYLLQGNYKAIYWDEAGRYIYRVSLIAGKILKE